MDVLGISAGLGPSAACLTRDGRVVAAAREDRFTRRAGDSDFPRQAVEYCLRAGKIGPASLGTAVISGPGAYRESGGGSPSFLRRIFGGARQESPESVVARELDPAVPVHVLDPADAHAAGAFLPSPFDEAAVLVLGDADSGLANVIARGSGDTLDRLEATTTAAGADPRALARRAREATGLDRLTVGGPRAAEPRVIGALNADGLFREVWIQPASAGGADALGAALRFTERKPGGRAPGPAYNAHQVRTFLRSRDVAPEELPRDDVATPVAARLTEGMTVGWFAGRLDLDENATASRAVLSLPRRDAPLDAETTLVVAAERADELFEIDPTVRSPLVLAIARDDRLATGGRSAPVPVFRAGREDHRALHDLLSALASSHDVPVLAARPLARPGEPVACTPRDAYEVFESLGIDVLVMERYLVRVARRDATG